MRQGFQKYSDIRQGYFLKSTGDIALNKRQRHATLAFLKIDRRHWDPPSRAPVMCIGLCIDMAGEQIYKMYFPTINYNGALDKMYFFYFVISYYHKKLNVLVILFLSVKSHTIMSTPCYITYCLYVCSGYVYHTQPLELRRKPDII